MTDSKTCRRFLQGGSLALAFLFSNMRMLYSMDPLVGQAALGMRLLELIAVGFLTHATLK